MIHECWWWATDVKQFFGYWQKPLYSVPWKCENIQILFTEQRISVAGNFEANSCQLSTLNMGMIRENINIFDINVKPPLTFSICLSNSILKVLSSAILCSNRSDWLNPVQELFYWDWIIISCKNCSVLWHETVLSNKSSYLQGVPKVRAHNFDPQYHNQIVSNFHMLCSLSLKRKFVIILTENPSFTPYL